MNRAKILDGRQLAQQLQEQLKKRVEDLKLKGVQPCLEVIVAAQDPASMAYVKMKQLWAKKIGIESGTYEVNPTTTLEELLAKINEHNQNKKVHGILIQHPLPKPIDEPSILLALGAEKDVDGMTPHSLGNLVSDLPGFRCATALGIMTLLEHYQIPIAGKKALVIGRSIIVGKPVALMLLQKNATVTIAHSYTENLLQLCKEADIVVAAVGQPEMIHGEWVKPQAVVIDAGYNKLEGRSKDVGDVHFESASITASWITPVPGGVGPMTVISLLRNTVDAAEKTIR